MVCTCVWQVVIKTAGDVIDSVRLCMNVNCEHVNALLLLLFFC